VEGLASPWPIWGCDILSLAMMLSRYKSLGSVDEG